MLLIDYYLLLFAFRDIWVSMYIRLSSKVLIWTPPRFPHIYAAEMRRKYGRAKEEKNKKEEGITAWPPATECVYLAKSVY